MPSLIKGAACDTFFQKNSRTFHAKYKQKKLKKKVKKLFAFVMPSIFVRCVLLSTENVESMIIMFFL